MIEKKNRFYTALNYIIFIILIVYSLLPVALTVINAFLSSPGELKNILLLSVKFKTAFNNSLFYTLFITVGQVVFGVWTAFIFSRFKFKFREIIFGICILIMILPIHTTIVQTYNVIKSLSLYDSYAGAIIPQIFLPTGIIFLRQYIMRIPDSVIDAAQIDGASTLRILFKIVIPMSKNGIVLLTFMSFIDSYNTYEIPLVILKEEIKKPLSLIIRNVVENYPEQAFVPALLYMIPAILLFGMLRDNIINGITYNE